MRASALITDAFYLSGKVARDYEVVEGSDGNDGLVLLNDIIAELSIDADRINYYTYKDPAFVTEPNVETYFVAGLIKVSTMTFNINSVRYGQYRKGRRSQFGRFRVDNVNTLPFTFYADRQMGGTLIYLYPIPDQAYPIKIEGKFSIPPVTFTTDMTTIFETFFISYLKYKLAYRIVDFYDLPSLSETKIATLNDLERKLDNITGMDLEVNSPTMFGPRGVGIYGMANLGHGWVPY